MLEQPPEKAADFRHVRTWIFDLDNTLYRADCGIFAQIESRMTDFVAAETGTARDEARRIQKQLYREHGTTLNGLMVTRGVDPEAFLDYVHAIDLGDLASDPALGAALARLPGRRTVFTNGCRHHAGRILERLGIAHLFETIWDIRSIGFTPKPDPRAYARVVAEAGIAPERAAMFDDIVPNLYPAGALGMTTVWLRPAEDWSAHADLPETEFPVAPGAGIDHETANLAVFLNGIRT